MQLNPYLHFNGNCEAALKFYEKNLGGTLGMVMRYSDAPPPKDKDQACGNMENMANKIMHARITIGEQIVMASDCPEGKAEPMKGFCLNLNFTKPGDADRVFNALLEKGHAIMPIAETFWAVRFGMLVDQFGVPWMVNCERAR